LISTNNSLNMSEDGFAGNSNRTETQTLEEEKQNIDNPPSLAETSNDVNLSTVKSLPIIKCTKLLDIVSRSKSVGNVAGSTWKLKDHRSTLGVIREASLQKMNTKGIFVEDEESQRTRIERDETDSAFKESCFCKPIRMLWFFIIFPFGVLFYLIDLVFSNPMGALLTSCGCSGKRPPANSDGQTVDILFDEGIFFGKNFGVAKFIKSRESEFVNYRYFGRSAGTLVALSIALDIDVEEFLEIGILQKLIKLHRNHSPFRICGTAHFFLPVLDKILPNNAHIKAMDNNFFASVSCFPFGSFRWLGQFDSRDELMEAVLVSCSLPGVLSWRPRVVC
jgi:hypothetical protein